jgi:hypothetical protein
MTHQGQIPILAIVEHNLGEIKLPPLIRPDVPNDKPDEKLVMWGVTYYAYCVIAHMQTVLSGIVQLLEAKNVPTALVVGRHIFEWTATLATSAATVRLTSRRKNGEGHGICTR